MSMQHIAIVGAGPSGLSLARILQCHPIPFTFTVYEGDASPTSRPQGGSLDLHPPSGLAVLREGGLMEAFDKHARYQDQRYIVADKHGKFWLDHKFPEGATGRPEIDRQALREILAESIEPKNIKWNHEVSEIKSTDDGRFELHFRNQRETVIANLVVGADGTWSKVRPLGM